MIFHGCCFLPLLISKGNARTKKAGGSQLIADSLKDFNHFIFEQ